jgi:hypothetical protein
MSYFERTTEERLELGIKDNLVCPVSAHVRATVGGVGHRDRTVGGFGHRDRSDHSVAGATALRPAQHT